MSSTAPDKPTASPLHFLRAVISGDRDALAGMTFGRKIDFDALGDFLIEGRMGVYVHARLKELNLTALLPVRVRQSIEQQHAAQLERNNEILTLLAEVQQAMSREGIDVLVIKGFPLAQLAWGGIDRRFSFDLDLFVAREQFPAAIACLQRLGLNPPAMSPGASRLVLKFSHALELRRGHTSLDLHWTLRNRPGLRFDHADLWASAKPCEVNGITCKTLSDEYLLVTLLSGLANDLERGHQRERSFWDIYFLLKQLNNLDWSAFHARFARQGLQRMLPAMLALVMHRLACADEFPAVTAYLASQSEQLLQPEQFDKLLANAPQSFENRHWFSSLLPVPRWYYWAWWGSTLPIRYWLGRHI